MLLPRADNISLVISEICVDLDNSLKPRGRHLVKEVRASVKGLVIIVALFSLTVSNLIGLFCACDYCKTCSNRRSFL